MLAGKYVLGKLPNAQNRPVAMKAAGVVPKASAKGKEKAGKKVKEEPRTPDSHAKHGKKRKPDEGEPAAEGSQSGSSHDHLKLGGTSAHAGGGWVHNFTMAPSFRNTNRLKSSHQHSLQLGAPSLGASLWLRFAICIPSRPKLLQKILFKKNCFGGIDFVKITKQSLYKANSFACSLVNR